MKSLGALLFNAVAFTGVGCLAVSVQPEKRSLTAVTVKGNAFFAGDSRFYIRGVDYQPGGSSNVVDPIANVDGCKRDVPVFKKLGVNTIRVYSVDNTLDHDACMSLLADAGIYLVLDVNSPKYSLNRADPGPSYNDVYLQSIFATIDGFAKYDNMLAFFSGNEVINDAGSTRAAPFVKAVTRDIRQYIRTRGYRSIPVGYSAADVSENRREMADYMNCGTDDERSDFFAFNDYSWCDPSTFTKSGWDQKVKNFSDYSLPIFLSEYGCNTNKRRRQFLEVASLFSTDMSSVFSGGLVYEYSEEGSDYGLVKLNGNSVEELDDFKTLQAAFSKQNKNPSGDGGYKTNNKASTCPAKSTNWEVDGDSLPAMPEPAKKFLEKGAGKGAGLEGPGSQNAGTPSTSTATPGSGASAPSSTKKGSASTLHPSQSFLGPVVCALVVLVSSLLGTTLL
ncbi:MAG: beta-glucanosyltransferase [Peltula sp. TS41687]|nr:MAG: beta-glucanosyltransferase [Peltula sp. TS41687]